VRYIAFGAWWIWLTETGEYDNINGNQGHETC